MTALLATVVDVKALLETAAFSLAAGAGTSVAFALAILGTTRFADLRRDDRTIEAGAFAALAAVAVTATAAAVVFGLIVMTSK